MYRKKPLKRTPLKRDSKQLKRTRIKRGARRSRYSRRPRYVNYLLWLKQQPCAVCGRIPSDAAHVGERGLSRKCHDSQAIPLCHQRHHQEGESSHHVLGKYFWEKHGLDRDTLVAFYNRLWISQTGLTFTDLPTTPNPTET